MCEGTGKGKEVVRRNPSCVIREERWVQIFPITLHASRVTISSLPLTHNTSLFAEYGSQTMPHRSNPLIDMPYDE